MSAYPLNACPSNPHSVASAYALILICCEFIFRLGGELALERVIYPSVCFPRSRACSLTGNYMSKSFFVVSCTSCARPCSPSTPSSPPSLSPSPPHWPPVKYRTEFYTPSLLRFSRLLFLPFFFLSLSLDVRGRIFPMEDENTLIGISNLLPYINRFRRRGCEKVFVLVLIVGISLTGE